MNDVIGIDLYNQCLTGAVAKTMNTIASDADHVPCVLIVNSSGGGIAGTLDSSYYKGQGLRQGIEREYLVIGDVSHLCREEQHSSSEAKRLQRSDGGDL